MVLSDRLRIVTYWHWGMYWRLCWRSVRDVSESKRLLS